MADNSHTRVTTAGPAVPEHAKSLKARLVFERRMRRTIEGEMMHLLFGNQLLVGRDKTCEIPIIDDRISRKHVLIRIDPDAVRLSDLGSTNGSTRNQEQITEEIILDSGDIVTFGQAKTFETRITERDRIITSVRLASGPEAYLLVPQEFIIGFADPAAADVDLKIYDPAIIPKHARIEFFAGQTFIISLDPDRPVIVNGAPARELEIRNNYLIEIGDTLLRFERT